MSGHADVCDVVATCGEVCHREENRRSFLSPDRGLLIDIGRRSSHLTAPPTPPSGSTLFRPHSHSIPPAPDTRRPPSAAAARRCGSSSPVCRRSPRRGVATNRDCRCRAPGLSVWPTMRSGLMIAGAIRKISAFLGKIPARWPCRNARSDQADVLEANLIFRHTH